MAGHRATPRRRRRPPPAATKRDARRRRAAADEQKFGHHKSNTTRKSCRHSRRTAAPPPRAAPRRTPGAITLGPEPALVGRDSVVQFRSPAPATTQLCCGRTGDTLRRCSVRARGETGVNACLPVPQLAHTRSQASAICSLHSVRHGRGRRTGHQRLSRLAVSTSACTMSATQPRFTGAPSGPGAMGGPARAAGRFTLGQTAIWPVALA